MPRSSFQDSVRSCARALVATALPVPTALACAALACLQLDAAASTPPAPQESPERGLRKVDPGWHVLVHARAIVRPGAVLEDATIVVRDGRIVSVAAGGAAPPGARVLDCTGLTVYAGLVEAHLAVDAPIAATETTTDHWHHQLVTPQRSALDGAGVDAAVATELRKLGFCAAAIAPRAGIFRGTASVVALGAAGDGLVDANRQVLAEDVAQVMGFDRGGFGSSGELGYPSSEMGAIALARQTLLDAELHARSLAIHAAAPASSTPPAPSRALETLNGAAPLLFDARSELQVLRAAKLAREFARPMIVLGSGNEYRRLAAVRATGLPIIAPLTFEEAPDVSTQMKAEGLALRDLMAWEQAPTNPRRLHEAGVRVALTTARLDPVSEFPARLRKALQHGLGEDDALAMLTTVPAELLGLGAQLGQIAPGYFANLVVADGPLFAESTKLREVLVMGRRHVIEAAPGPDHIGLWDVVIERLGARENVVAKLTIEKGDKVRFALEPPTGALPSPEGGAPEAEGAQAAQKGERGAKIDEARKVQMGRHNVHFHVDGKALGLEGVVALSGIFEGDVLHGTLVGPDGVLQRWRATRAPAAAPPKEATPPEAVAAAAAGDAPKQEEPKTQPPAPGSDVPKELGLPFGEYALAAPPEQRDVRFEGATLWTSASAGIVPDGVLVITGGRVAYAGPAAGAPATPSHQVIDARGKHLTPGLIDCHSHTGISGSVNEGGQRVTCEVRIADVIDPDSISFYHQLAGGLTAANQLHGSANAIGGQNSVVKLRWGAVHPDDLRLAGAPEGVKFALGENPKRVAAGDEPSDEYPQTRLGVEALIRDRLNAGKHYAAEWARYGALSEWERRTVLPPRRDLELEALAEIAAGTRWIHCHSYRQDEILMLARMAQEYGIRIGTFQHVLEGYKVAEAIVASARGASSFADWWAYKFEVVDAIPESPAIMHEVGVNVSINSDSDEFARRLNTEAAKGLKYGRMSPHDALCMVTINPAYQLGIEARVGSLEPGKDADFALWSGDPLSYTSRCEATWIDGREYFSLARDTDLRAEAARERQRILQKLMSPSAGDSKPAEGGARRRGAERIASGELTLREAYRLGLYDEIDALWRSGIDPTTAQPGVCGCWEVFLDGEQSLNETTEGSR